VTKATIPFRRECSFAVRTDGGASPQNQHLQVAQAVATKKNATRSRAVATQIVKLPKLGRPQLTLRELLAFFVIFPLKTR
jgi:hypothetical protein